MFPFDRPNNYSEMLNKIGIFTFLETFGLTCLIGYLIQPIGTALGSLKMPVEVISIKIPILYVAPAAFIAVVARIVRLHDKLSDVFRIRETFDVSRILVPLAAALGIDMNPMRRKILKVRRESAMQNMFYAYASFEEPRISKALVLSAIDVWTWYWILAELIFVLFLSAITFVLFQKYRFAIYVLAAICLLGVLFSTAFTVCGDKARKQIDEIISDPNRVKSLNAEFTSLFGTNG